MFYAFGQIEQFISRASEISLLNVVFIIVGGLLLHFIGTSVVCAAVSRGVTMKDQSRKKRPKAETKQRISTLCDMIRKVFRITIFVVIIMMLLAEAGINIAPMLAGAGILGVALGFGSQTIVKDFLAGLFILVEDQFSIGDYVKIAGISGTAEDMTLRRTVLRDIDGVEHHIPNSAIKTVSNYTKNWSSVKVDIAISYEVDLKKALTVARKTVSDFSKLQHNKSALVKEPEVLGVVDYTTNGMLIRILGRSKSHKQWELERELRQKLQIAFRKEKIKMGAQRWKLE